jgi:hypothetical protein
MKIKNKIFSLLLLIVFSVLSLGWAFQGHFIINENIKYFLNPVIALKYNDLFDFVKNHASDADERKNSDPLESDKHFIDIDSYPEFVSTGKINHDYNYNVSYFGNNWVTNTGLLPWTIVSNFDSLTACFKRNDKSKIYVIAADLGHYIGDMHNPFHLTKNYNGQYSGQKGVHSRYELTLISKYSFEIIYSGDISNNIIPDIPSYVFERIYSNYKKLDTILKADLESYALAGNQYNDYYYKYLWDRTKNITIELMKNASIMLAEIIFNAYYRAGLYLPAVVNKGNEKPSAANGFSLSQNYPNPFNPTTEIEYYLPFSGYVEINIYNSLGELINKLEHGYKEIGRYKTSFNASGVPGGVYIYRLTTKSFSESRKMVLLR